MQAIISLEEGYFSYGSKDVFSGISLEAARGEIICILGANGCGKTTLLNCLNGTFKLKSGRILLFGKDLSKLSVTDRAKKMGFVFQEHSAPFPFSVLEVVRMGRAPHLGLFASPAARDTEVAINALKQVGMSHLIQKPYTQISGGERQLVLIARTIAQGPDIILMDEPTSHLDFKNQSLVLTIIKRLAQTGISIILSTHLPNHALLYASRVALMEDGRFLAFGRPEEVMTSENLRNTYGIEVKVLSVNDPQTGNNLRYVIPAEETKVIKCDKHVFPPAG